MTVKKTRNRKSTPIEIRFWAKVDKKDVDDCWNWIAKGRVQGYGVIGRQGKYGKKVLAHRLSYEIHNGPIPENKDLHHGYVVMHTCDNRLCVNPSHLVLGTQKENVRDMDKKGRRKVACKKGSSHHMTSITEEQAAQIYGMSGVYRAIAEHIGCTLAVVKSIKRQVTWSHVTSGLTKG